MKIISIITLNILLALHYNNSGYGLSYFGWGVAVGILTAFAILIIIIAPQNKQNWLNFFKARIYKNEDILEEMNESLIIDNITLQNQTEKLNLENQILASFSEEIDNKRKKIEEQQIEISSSISYASIIQNALFPSESLLDEIFADYFIFFRPRDSVSGDFYFARKHRNKTLLVIADCTGHGVPGAFLSVLGFSLLEQIVKGIQEDSASVLMNRLRRIFKSTLGQNRLEETNRDSIDMGFLIIDTELKQLNFSGANNDLYFIRASGEPTLCKGDRMPVGVHENDFVPFRDYYLQYNEGDCVYLFTDGYPDQFGGRKGKKYGRSRFKEFLLYMHDLPMKQQQEAIKSNLNEWMDADPKETFQVDDILVSGIRF